MRTETVVVTRKKHIGFVLTIILYICAASVARAQDKAILVLAEKYSAALKRFEVRKGRSSLETVVHKGKAVSDKLDEIESLSEIDYALLKKKMRGFTVNREEILFIVPESKFFARLAATRGTRADIAFFFLMRKIKPDDVWTAYTEQQTDVTGCTIYGNGSLTKLYGRILKFRRTYPRSYNQDINDESAAILEEFTGNTCACGTRNSVIREFGSFLKAFPKDKRTREIRDRLLTIRKSKDFRFSCHSG